MSLKEDVLKLKKEKNAIILAHYYVDGAVQDVADFVGDSYALAKINNQKRISLFATHPPIEVRIQHLQEML